MGDHEYSKTMIRKEFSNNLQIHYARWFSWIRPPNSKCILDYHLPKNIFVQKLSNDIFIAWIHVCVAALDDEDRDMDGERKIASNFV